MTTEKSGSKSEAFLGSATEGSTAGTEAPASKRIALFCETCGGDGGKSLRPFDANCPAAWAHRFVSPSPFAASLLKIAERHPDLVFGLDGEGTEF